MEERLPDMITRIRFSQASKKKNVLVLNIRTSMTELDAMTAMRAVMFIALIMLSTTYPAPARDRPLNETIFGSCQVDDRKRFAMSRERFCVE